MVPEIVKNNLCNLGNRGNVLQTVNQGVAEKNEIVEEVGKSRSSVDRDIRLLIEDGYIRQQKDGYELTMYGQCALKIYDQAVRLGSVEPYTPYLPTDLPFSVVVGSELREAGGAYPRKPIFHAHALIESAESVQILTPSIFPMIVDHLVKRILNNSLEVDAIVSDDVLRELMVQYQEDVPNCVEQDNCTIWRTMDPLTHGILLIDEEIVNVAIYDGSVRFLGTLTSESTDAIEWASASYRKCRTESERVFFRGKDQSLGTTLSV